MGGAVSCIQTKDIREMYKKQVEKCVICPKIEIKDSTEANII